MIVRAPGEVNNHNAITLIELGAGRCRKWTDAWPECQPRQ
jgi:hypothetical protein